MAIDSFWTTEKVERLRALWLTGLSLAEIGGELGCTRGAVSGKGRTLGLGPRGTQAARGRIVSARTERRKRVAAVKPAVAVVHAAPQVRGTARNPGFTFAGGVTMTKGEMMEMLRQAVENTK